MKATEDYDEVNQKPNSINTQTKVLSNWEVFMCRLYVIKIDLLILPECILLTSNQNGSCNLILDNKLNSLCLLIRAD